MIQNRIEKIRKLLTDKQLDALVISSVSNIFYLTGISHFSKEEREAYLLITASEAYFLTTSLYMEEVKKRTSAFSYHEIGRDRPFVKILKIICEQENIHCIGFEEHDIRYFEYHWMSKVVKKLQPMSIEIRMQKDVDEITQIKKACEMGDKAFHYALQYLKEGVTEKDIAIHIELFLKQHHADISFRPIVGFGQNSSMPHHESNDQKLKAKDIVLIDMGAKVDGYCSDMTRTVFFGTPSQEAKKIYTTVLTSQQMAIDYITQQLGENKPIIGRDVDQMSRNYIIEQGYPPIPHALGHGIGIDVHEPPRLGPIADTLLSEGMVFSIEPGIYLPKFMGVRIEDLVMIENNHLTILTLSPRELFVL